MQYLFSVGSIVQTNIGLYNVAELKGVYCTECNHLLGTYLSDSEIYSDINLLCYLCTNNLVLVADTLGFISPNGWAGCLENLPSEQDLVRLDTRNKRKDGSLWNINIRAWSNDIRNEHQAEKVRKLQNG